MTRPTGSISEAPEQRRSLEERFRPYAWAALAVTAGVALREGIDPLVGSALPFITLFPAVFIAAYVGGFGPAILATLLSVVAALHLFLEPNLSSHLRDPVAQLGAG